MLVTTNSQGESNIEKLTGLLNPGVNAQFNSMFLDPYLWKMQIGGKRLVQRARENGAPIDGVVIFLVTTLAMNNGDPLLALGGDPEGGVWP